MGLPKVAPAILCCPKCKGDVSLQDVDVRCLSASCLGVFPFVDGVPILIDEADSIFSIEEFQVRPQAKPFLWKRIKSAGLGILPSLDLNVSGKSNIKRLSEQLFERTENPVILNIGGKHPTSACARLCSDPRVLCFELDVSFKPRTNMIAEAHNLPFRDASFDAVIIDGVLEHLLDPFAVADEIHRVLKPEGFVYSDTPFMLQVHGGGTDFFRFTHLGHRKLFQKFHELSSGITQGPAVALSYSIQYFMLSFGRSEAARLFVKAFCRVAFFWLKYLDLLLASKPGALDAAHGIYFLGQKSARSVSDIELISSYEGITINLYPIGRVTQFQVSEGKRKTLGSR